MAEIIPFKGLLYNPQKVDVTSVVAPPYDIVSPELKDELYRRSPYNIIRVDYGKEEDGDDERNNRYTRASHFLKEWVNNGILRQDEHPSFYCYQIVYELDGQQKTLSGLMGAVKIEEFGKGRIKPHEVTYSKPKSDRLNILRYCMANISPIFSLYSSKEMVTSSVLRDISKEDPVLEAKNGNGFIHRLWRIEDSESIRMIIDEFIDKDIFIADGHHRYETALEFRNEMNKTRDSKPWDYVLMFLANMEEDGLTLLPTHRMVRLEHMIDLKEVLSPYFDISPLNIKMDSGRGILKAIEDSGSSIGMLLNKDETLYSLRPRPSIDIDTQEIFKCLGVTILHDLIFKKILRIEDFEYEMDIPMVIEKVRKGQYHVAFFLTPTRVEDVRRVALAGLRMPPKSTYFYPKLLTGMVIYKF